MWELFDSYIILLQPDYCWPVLWDNNTLSNISLFCLLSFFYMQLLVVSLFTEGYKADQSRYCLGISRSYSDFFKSTNTTYKTTENVVFLILVLVSKLCTQALKWYRIDYFLQLLCNGIKNLGYKRAVGKEV